MARDTVIRVLERRRKYHWPEAQLNFWLVIMIASGATILGIFVYFMAVQSWLQAGQIWYASTPFPPYSPTPPPLTHPDAPTQ